MPWSRGPVGFQRDSYHRMAGFRRIAAGRRVTVRVAYSPRPHADGGCLTRGRRVHPAGGDRSGEYRISSEYGPPGPSPTPDQC